MLPHRGALHRTRIALARLCMHGTSHTNLPRNVLSFESKSAPVFGQLPCSAPARSDCREIQNIGRTLAEQFVYQLFVFSDWMTNEIAATYRWGIDSTCFPWSFTIRCPAGRVTSTAEARTQTQVAVGWCERTFACDIAHEAVGGALQSIQTGLLGGTPPCRCTALDRSYHRRVGSNTTARDGAELWSRQRLIESLRRSPELFILGEELGDCSRSLDSSVSRPLPHGIADLIGLLLVSWPTGSPRIGLAYFTLCIGIPPGISRSRPHPLALITADWLRLGCAGDHFFLVTIASKSQ